MKKLLLLTLSLTTAISSWATTPIRIVGQPRNANLYRNIVEHRVLKRGDNYYKAIVKLHKKGERFLEVMLLAKKSYDLKIVKVGLTQDDRVTRVTRNVTKIPSIRIPNNILCPDPTVDAVLATPLPEIESARQGVEAGCGYLHKAGLKCKVLKGAQANVANYKRYLRYCPKLKIFGNIGHGNKYRIALADGSLSYSWLNSLAASKATKGKVIYFNSCKVHNNPLRPAVMNSGARTFIGGITSLLIGPSEDVFTCFMRQAVLDHQVMGDALRDCEDYYYPTTGNHGISGFTGKFHTPTIVLPHPPHTIPHRPIPRPRPPRTPIIPHL